MKIYREEIKIPYYEGDYRGYLRPECLFNYLGEVSIIHNNLMPKSRLAEKDKLGWMLRNWKLSMKKYPKVGSKLLIETWISRVETFFVYREFNILGDNGEKLGQATALWFFIDTVRKRPTRLSDKYMDLEELVPINHYSDFKRYPRDLNLSYKKDFSIRLGDIDFNGHVNNVSYIIWFLESLDLKNPMDYYLSELEIEYKRELIYPGDIESLSSLDCRSEKPEKSLYTHGIREKGQLSMNAIGRTVWNRMG